MENMGVIDGMDRMSIIKEESVELLSQTNTNLFDIGNPKWLSVPKDELS